MFRRPLRAFALVSSITALFTLSACGEKEKACLRDVNCEAGERCIVAEAGEPGICQACPAQEIPYDGEDNDCNPTTRDLDLDKDMDNAINSPVRPGGDCDDNDPTVSSLERELCGDNKDNNCNTRVDEPECADERAPMITFVQPAPGAFLSGMTEIVLDAQDDIQVASVELFRDGTSVGTVMAAPYRFFLDTTALPDGQLRLRAIATDLTDKVGEAEITVFIDNMTGPVIMLARPTAAGPFGGTMTVEITAGDSSGVASLELSLDGQSLATTTSTRILEVIDTRSLSDGEHRLQVSARDRLNTPSTQEFPFVVDNTGPAIVFAPPPGTQLMGVSNFTLTASDASAVAWIDSNWSDRANAATVNFTIDTLEENNGRLTVTASAADTAIIDDGQTVGNVGLSSANYTVANMGNGPPRIEIVSPLNNDEVYRNQAITASITAPAGVQTVEIYVNGNRVYASSTAPYTHVYNFARHVDTANIRALVIDTRNQRAETMINVRVVRPASFRVPDEAFPFGNLASTNWEVGDINRDGRIDIIAAGAGVSWIPNTGNAVFGPPEIVETGIGNVAVARLGRLNSDNLPDVWGLRLGGIDIYRNDGNGIFVQVHDLPVANIQPTDVAIADIDGDGDDDFVVSQLAPGTDVRVYRNDGAGDFPMIDIYGSIGNVARVLLQDVDNDNDRDIVVGRRGAGLDLFTVYRNNGNGVFGAGQDTFTMGQAEAVAVGDVNQDGYPDIVAAIRANQNSRVVLTIGNPATPGNFTIDQNWEFNRISAASGVAIGDMDGDGDNEIVATFENADRFAVFTRRPDNTYQIDQYIGARGARNPYIANLDSDPLNELLISSPGNQSIAVIDNINGVLNAAPSEDMPRTPGALAVANIGGDALPDVAITFASGGAQTVPQVAELINTAGRFTIGDRIDLGLNSEPTSIAAGDLDGMGGIDYAVGSGGGASQNSAAIVTDSGVVPLRIATPRSAAIGDVDGMPGREVVFTTDALGAGNDGALVFSPTGTQLYQLRAGTRASHVMIGNIDNDGDPDIGVTNTDTEDVTLFNVIGGQPVARTFSAVPEAVYSALGYLGPAPRDNYQDLIVGGRNVVGVLLGDPAFDFAPVTQWPAGLTLTRLYAADFNNDGLSDAVALSPTDDQIAVLIARSRGGFFSADTIDVGEAPVDLAIADFNGDGRLDMAVTTRIIPGLQYFYNTF